MGYNGAGVYSLPLGSIISDGTDAEAADLNTPLVDLEDSLSLVHLSDGRKAAEANWPMGGFKLTGLANGSAATDSAALSQVQTSVVQHSSAVGGTADAIQITLSPASTTLTTNEVLRWKSGGANTVTAPTLSKDSGTTNKTIKKGVSAALAVGDTGASGYECEAIYNGTDWILLNPATEGGNVLLAGSNAFTGNNTHAGTESFSKAVIYSPVTLTDEETVSWDASTGTNFQVTLGGNRTLGAFTGGAAGQRGTLRVIQDATGGRTLNLSDAVYDFSGGQIEPISTGANEVTEYEFEVIAANTAMRLKRKWMSGLSSMGFFKEYDKGALADSTIYTQAHGLARQPALVAVFIENTTTEAGWAVGDRLLFASASNSNTGASVVFTVGVNATNVYVSTGGAVNIGVNHRTTGAATFITPSKWKVIVRVYE